MKPGRKAIALWLLLLWLLAGLASQAMPRPAWGQAQPAGLDHIQWHTSAAQQHKRMDLIAERLPAQRAGSRTDHDVLPATARATPPRQQVLQPVPAAPARAHAAPAPSPYRARAPPARA